MDDVIQNLLALLERFIQENDTLPLKPQVFIDSFNERSVGLGNWVSDETRGQFGTLGRKGGRLEAVVRFQFLADSLDAVNTNMAILHNQLLAAKNNQELVTTDDDPQPGRVLRLAAERSPLAEHIPSLDSWQKTADYRILYEYEFLDLDTQGLIARILIDIDSQYNESSVVTDEMVRWDNQAAPALEVRGRVGRPFHVRMLSMLTFLPTDWEGSEVTLSVSNNGTAHEHTFASVQAFWDAFTQETERDVVLGGNSYSYGHFMLPGAQSPEAIVLKGGDDIFRIRYAAPAFDSEAVVYLRVLS